MYAHGLPKIKITNLKLEKWYANAIWWWMNISSKIIVRINLSYIMYYISSNQPLRERYHLPSSSYTNPMIITSVIVRPDSNITRGVSTQYINLPNNISPNLMQQKYSILIWTMSGSVTTYYPTALTVVFRIPYLLSVSIFV